MTPTKYALEKHKYDGALQRRNKGTRRKVIAMADGTTPRNSDGIYLYIYKYITDTRSHTRNDLYSREWQHQRATKKTVVHSGQITHGQFVAAQISTHTHTR